MKNKKASFGESTSCLVGYTVRAHALMYQLSAFETTLSQVCRKNTEKYKYMSFHSPL